MDQVHDFHLQLLQEIGFVREIDQALSKSLMVEFLRLKTIIGDDLSGALRTWQTDMEVTTDKFLRDLDATTQTSTALPSKNAAVGVAFRQFRAASQLRVALPLTQLDEAREEMETFIQSRLEELRSPQETKNLIGELSSRITNHRGRVRELLCSKSLRHPEVAPLIMVGLAADRPIESNFFPGLLEGLLGSLGLATPGEGNPPVSSRKGTGHAWSTAMHGAISRTKQREVEAPEAVGLPPNLDLQYKEGFLERQRHLIPPIFSDPLFIPKVAEAVFRVEKPLVVSKMLPAARSHKVSSAPPQPGGGGPKQQVLKSEEPVPSTSQSVLEVQEQISKASNTDSDGADEPLRRGNCLVEPSRSNFLLNSLSMATRPWRAVPMMVSHPPKCARSQRPRKPRLAPRPGPRRQPSRKLGLNCSKRTSPWSRRFVPRSSNSRREK